MNDQTSTVIYKHSIWNHLRSIARKRSARIVLCEGEDDRVIQAAGIIIENKLAKLTLIGDYQIIVRQARKFRVDLNTVTCIDPWHSEYTDQVALHLYEHRKSKGMTEEQARTLSTESLPFGFGLLALGKADGAVAGAVKTTSETVRSAMYSLNVAKGHKIIIGVFLVEAPYAERYGSGGGFVFADCGVTPEPSPRMLARIAYDAAGAFKAYFNDVPRVAFLSFSTRGSASHERVDRVVQAAACAKKLFPDLQCDGELQLDSALDSMVAQRKGVADSPVTGRANVLIFPDLDSGNITYKAVQRFGQARTIGPILWGLEKPVSDLSRGCSIDDIVCTVSAVGARC